LSDEELKEISILIWCSTQSPFNRKYEQKEKNGLKDWLQSQ
jgi:hypothetical protein